VTPEEINRTLEQFKIDMVFRYPFYGDILLRLPIRQDDSVGTACTNGRSILWDAHFFKYLTTAQIRYVLMHEVFHVLLCHPSRANGRRPDIWNVAVDIIVNHYVDQISARLTKEPGLIMNRPPSGIFRDTSYNETAENLYAMILEDNRDRAPGSGRLLLRNTYRDPKSLGRNGKVELQEVKIDCDLILGETLSKAEQEELERMIGRLIQDASSHEPGSGGSLPLPRELLTLTRHKPLDWRRILKDFLSEAQSDDTSYVTPERKYLHMDLILPGHGLSEEGELEQAWAFIDSSGSVGQDALRAFLTQLYLIAKDFNCQMNIAYWDTEVTDVYEKLRNEKQVLTAQPTHSGGTDINCVYRYVRDRHLKPLVTLILTDGYFGTPDPMLKKALDPRSTILLLCNDSVNPVYSTVGRVCRLDPS